MQTARPHPGRLCQLGSRNLLPRARRTTLELASSHGLDLVGFLCNTSKSHGRIPGSSIWLKGKTAFWCLMVFSIILLVSSRFLDPFSRKVTCIGGEGRWPLRSLIWCVLNTPKKSEAERETRRRNRFVLFMGEEPRNLRGCTHG